jgi:hypothetical protein
MRNIRLVDEVAAAHDGKKRNFHGWLIFGRDGIWLGMRRPHICCPAHEALNEFNKI